MKIDVNVKHKFKVNGKEYGSVEEMPENIREAFEKARASQSAMGRDVILQQKIILNGTEYESIDAMPADVRQLYEKVLDAASNGTAPDDDAFLAVSPNLLQGTSVSGLDRAASKPPPIKMESAFSPGRLIVIILVGALAFAIYYLWQSG